MTNAEQDVTGVASDEAGLAMNQAVAIPNAEREAELLKVIGLVLSNLGSENGYFPSIGSPNTKRLIAAYRAYGFEPEFGRCFKWGM